MGAKAGTPQADRLDVLATIIDAYKTEHDLMARRPIDAIQFRIEQQGSRKDLEEIICSCARIAEVLNRKRACPSR